MKLRELIPQDIWIKIIGLTKDQIKKLPSGIVGLERTSSLEELITYYQGALAFVNPSKNDTFPTVNLESLACGTPVITYRTGGSPEAVDAKTGIVVEKGDINGLAQAIKYIIDNPDKYSVENCRKRAVEKFNKDIQFNKYIDLYEDLLGASLSIKI